jgi:hypothetical protein
VKPSILGIDSGQSKTEAERDGIMTESEWNTATDPEVMLEFLGHSRFAFMKSGHKLSARKFRLCAVAVCRRVWSLLTDAELRTAVETAERYADGDATEEEFADACSDAGARSGTLLSVAFSAGDRESYARANAASAASSAVRSFAFDAAKSSVYFAGLAMAGNALGQSTSSPEGMAERLAQAELLRDIFGNPWRSPATLGIALQTVPIVRMAAEVYESRSSERLPELAAALEEAGCDDAELLGHLRGETPHVRGCWALDAVLGKQ